MEKIKLITKESLVHVKNPFCESIVDYLTDNTFVFDKGKIYGIICEHGCGGDAISAIMSNYVTCKTAEVHIDDVKATALDVKNLGWYLGSPIYTNGLIKRERSVKKALKYAIKKYHRYECLEDVIDEFHLKTDRLEYGISKYSGEKWRASLAVGYVSNKKVYCFPWLNTIHIYNCLVNSVIYSFFKKMKDEGCIIIVPTSRCENVAGFADEIIELRDTRFEHVISENEYFKQYY